MTEAGEASQSLDIILEFLEVCVHCVLHSRGLYPQGVFEKRLKYSVPVQMCLHPEVCGYISSVLQGLRLMMCEGRVDVISLVVLGEGGRPTEKFVFEVGQLKDRWRESDPHLFKVEQALRGFMLKLNVSDGLLRECAPDATWTIHAHTKESTLASAGERMIRQNFPWAEAEEMEREMTNTRIIPVKSISTDIFDMQLYVEQKDS